jgi:thiamine-monophosphate kinase
MPLPNPEAPLDEFAAIARFFAPLAAGFPGAFGLADDAAVLSPRAGCELVVTIDTLVAGVHFRADDPADGVGAKLLAVNLSDLAAMGARPVAYLLSLSLPRNWIAAGAVEAWLDCFTRGLREAQAEHAVHLVGGDTVATPGPLSLTVTACGEVEAGRLLRRAGAATGDDVWVTGSIGDAALGLLALDGRLPALAAAESEALVARYRRPTPRIAAGLALVGEAHACADISDGLVADLGHICAASGTGAVLDARRLPLSDAGRAALETDAGLLATILTGGDDYELVFTAAPADAPRIETASRRLALPMTVIGRIEPACQSTQRVRVTGPDGAPFAVTGTGYRHF